MSSLPLPSQDDRSRFDFFEGMRSFNYRALVKPLLDDYSNRAAARVADGGAEPTTKEEAGELYTSDPAYLFACAIQRSMQQMAWATAVASVHRHAEAFEDELAEFRDRNEHGVLETDPLLPLPDWFTERDRAGRDDIHLVPGGYWRDGLVGAVYDRGGAVYRLAWRAGYDARPGALESFVRSSRVVEPARVLDLGCSFGGLTRVLKKVFADAEVTGIDLSLPALAYAHALGERAGSDITYAQRDAAATGYPDGHFDLVSGFLLLHEVPDAARADILSEALRILKPGGELLFLDVPPYRALGPAEAFFHSFDDRGNGERFWDEFCAADTVGLLAELGGTDVEDGPLDFEEPGYWGSSALWRTGEFHPANRWVTRARKPADSAPMAKLASSGLAAT